MRAARGADEALIDEGLQDLGQEVLGDVHLAGDLPERDDRLLRDGGQVDHGPKAVVDLPRDPEYVLHRAFPATPKLPKSEAKRS